MEECYQRERRKELEQTAALLQGSPKECDPQRVQLQGVDGPGGTAGH